MFWFNLFGVRAQRVFCLFCFLTLSQVILICNQVKKHRHKEGYRGVPVGQTWQTFLHFRPPPPVLVGNFSPLSFYPCSFGGIDPWIWVEQDSQTSASRSLGLCRRLPHFSWIWTWRSWELPQILRMKLVQRKVGLQDGQKLSLKFCHSVVISQIRKLRLGETWLLVPNVEKTGFNSMKVRFQKGSNFCYKTTPQQANMASPLSVRKDECGN